MARTLVLDTITDPDNSTGNANITLSPDSTTTFPKVDINSGAIDNTTLGAAVPSSVAATTLSTTGNATAGGTLGVTGNTTIGGTLGVTGLSTLPTVDINGGAIDGTIIGANSAAAGTFTTGVFTTIDTGQGANELYDMNQNVKTDSPVVFARVNNLNITTMANDSSGSTGSLNVGIGWYAAGNVTGANNVAIGTMPMGVDGSTGVVSGNDNIAVGQQSLGNPYIDISGNRNVMVGNQTGYGCTSGHNNTALGSGAMMTLTSGRYNTGCGSDTIQQNQTGYYNTGCGYSAGYYVTGGNNLALGYNAGHSSSPSGAMTSGSNIICLGNNDISALYCADTSISSSDGRDKTDVEDFTPGLEWIEAMRPVTYHWDKRSWYTEVDEETGEVTSQPDPDGTHKKDKKNIGFIAQEVLAIEKANGFSSDTNDMLTVNLNEDGTAYGMKYERLVPVLVNAIKELSAKVKALESA